MKSSKRGPYDRFVLDKRYREWMAHLQVGDTVGVRPPGYKGGGSHPELWVVDRLTAKSVWLVGDARRYDRRTGFIVSAADVLMLVPIIVRGGQVVRRSWEDVEDMVWILIPWKKQRAQAKRDEGA